MNALNIVYRQCGSKMLISRPSHYVHHAYVHNKTPVMFKLVDMSTPNDPMFNMLQVQLPKTTEKVQMEVQFRNTSSQLGYLNPETYQIEIMDGKIECILEDN
jgi:hypothetical protein